MTQDLAPSDWTHQSFDNNSSLCRGIIRAIDEQSGIGIIATSNFQGAYLIFFLQDIDPNNGWQHGIGDTDNIEFEITEMSNEDIDYCQHSYLRKKFDHKLSKDSIAYNLVRLEPGSVILEQLLFDHPRYEGIVHTEPIPSVQHHAFGSYYGDEEPRGGIIRLIGPYHDTQIPPIQERYDVNAYDSNKREGDSLDVTLSDKPTALLQAGAMLHFEGKDLLSTRIVIRQGDRVEFDVYKDQRNRDVTYGATNIVFLDGSPDEKKHGFIYRFLSQTSKQQKFGLIKV